MRSRSNWATPRPKQPWEIDGNDRRRSARLYAIHSAMLCHNGRWSPTTVLDLSRHGARVCGTGTFKAGDDVTIELAAPCRRVQLEAHVVWNDHGRKRSAGIAFAPLVKDDALALDATLFELRRTNGPYDQDVLLVTDDPSAQLALANAIWQHEHEVAPRGTIDGALAYLEAHAPRARAAFVAAGFTAGSRLLDTIADRYPSLRRVLLVDNLMSAASTVGVTMPHFVLLSPFRSDAVAAALREPLV